MDDDTGVPGSRAVEEVLATDPLARLLGRRLVVPWVLAVVIVGLVLGAIVLGPSSDSRFIYTDF